MGYPRLKNKNISLRDAAYFHGHLGPYLVLGLKAGWLALKKLKADRYFGLEVRVFGLDKKPKSCIIDGLQLSTGATFGKGNILKFRSKVSKIEIFNRRNAKKITLTFKNSLVGLLEKNLDHWASEILAKKLFKTNPQKLFDVKK